jgi:hypothetical protein
MRPRKLLASTAICGVLLAGCIETPTEGQKAARDATQPTVTVIQPTTVTKTCEGTCTTTHTGTPTGSASANAPSVGTPGTTGPATVRATTGQETTHPTTGCEGTCTTTRTSAPSSAASASATVSGATTPRRTTVSASGASVTAYSRDQFGSGWADPDGNGCDGRQDAVARATTDQHRTSRCYIATGDVLDWYTGKVCNDCATRSYDVDHVVALADAWRSGANKWTRAKRIRYANDPLVLVLTNASLNRSKSDRGPDEWAPINHAAACKYVRRYEFIKRIYELHTTAAQRAAIRRTLTTC